MSSASPDVDAVVGAGFPGLYMLHRLRDTMGLTVRVFETGGGVGGTWYRNRYPGARSDSDSYVYGSTFDEGLWREWEWSEPDRYFIVVVNQIGSGLSTSPHNAPDAIAMSQFPKVRIGDDVVAQERAGIWAVMGFSTEFWRQEVWRALEFESKEAFLAGFLEPYFTVLDPNDLPAMAWKWQRGDVTRRLFGVAPTYIGQIDRHLGELLATPA